MTSAQEIADRLRQHIVSEGYEFSDRLPPERALCETLMISRHQLRNALVILEEDGLIWRHVGRGTFVGPRPVLDLDEAAYLRDLVTPEQLVAVRLSIEPELARLAAKHANTMDLSQIRTCADRCSSASDWRGYEAWDLYLHQAIARAAHNKLYLYFFETLNVVRRSFVWGQPRVTTGPAKDYSSFEQHAEIVQAIAHKNPSRAHLAMRQHLNSVYGRLFPDVIKPMDLTNVDPTQNM